MSGAGQVQAVGVTNFACALPQCSPPPTQVSFFQTWVSCLTLAQRCLWWRVMGGPHWVASGAPHAAWSLQLNSAILGWEL